MYAKPKPKPKPSLCPHCPGTEARHMLGCQALSTTELEAIIARWQKKVEALEEELRKAKNILVEAQRHREGKSV